MSENEQQPIEEQETHEEPTTEKGVVRIKLFALVMILFAVVLGTAGLTIFALTFGDEKVVEVVSPERREFSKLYQAYDEIKKNYFEDIDQEKLVNGAINGMVDALGDPYSDFMNEEEAAKFEENISSSFQGIGAEIQEKNGYIQVVSPIKNSPAEKAGLMPNDLITAVDGKSIQGMSASEAVLLIRGEKGTTVKLTIQRGEQADPMEVSIVRDDIPIETVYGEMRENGIAHVQITSFSERTYEELKTTLEDLDSKGMKGLVIDVRQNPGGLLTTAMDIANLFIEDGKPLFQTEERGKEPEIYYAKDGTKIKVPLAVLIDDGSASASEILAAALKESANVPLVGLNSFGKGTVQTANQLPDGSNMKFTTAKWLTPDGNWIHEKGIAPDYKVDYPAYSKLPFIDPSIEMKKDVLSEQVKAAEQMLVAVGINPGPQDGLYDDKTIEAVKKLQKQHKLEETGILTGESTYALMDDLRQKIQKDDPQLVKAEQLLMQKLNVK